MNVRAVTGKTQALLQQCYNSKCVIVDLYLLQRRFYQCIGSVLCQQ